MPRLVSMSTQVGDLAAPQWTFGDRIRKIRRDEKLTQAEFAEMIGRKDKAVGAWESGLNEPDDILSVARRIQEEFHVPATWVLGLDAPPPSGGGQSERARRYSKPQPSDPKVRGSHLILAAA